MTSTGNLGGIELQSNGAGAAFLAFHRPGLYASYFGIDTDNNFAIGGWSAGTGLGNMKVRTIYANNWFSSYGNTGWYNETHGGGIYMQDTTWVRVYNNKQFYSQNLIQSDTDIRAPIFKDSNNTGYYCDPASTSNISKLIANNRIVLFPTNDGRTNGLWHWGDGDSNWVQYMAQPTVGVNPAGGTMTAGYWDNSHNIRVRAGGWSVENFSDNSLRAHINGTGAYFAGQTRSPIFYDSNDTNYYCDPNATTRLNNLIITGTVSGIPTGGGITSINISGAGLSSNTLTSNGTLSLYGTLSLANGGTGSSLGYGSAGQVLTSNGGGGSYWNTPSGGGIATPVSKANGGTGSNLGNGSVGEVLISNGSSGSYWGTAVKPTTITPGNSQYSITLKTFDVSGSGSSYGIGLSIYNENTGTRGFLVAREAMSIGSSTSVTYSGATHTWFVDQFQRMILTGNALYPFDPVTYPINLGTTNYRWATAWVATGVWNGSDLREKTDIENSNLGLEFILKLRPVSYKWIKNKQNISAGITEATNYGFIAQEIGEIFGDQSFGGYAYDKDSDSYGLKYDQFIAPLVKAIQEQQQIINELKNDIEILKNK